MFKRTLPLAFVYVVLFAMMATLLLTFPKGELHILLNSYHTQALDIFMRYYTKLAEWPLYLLALVPLFWHKNQWVTFYLVSEGVGALLTTILKHIFRMPRPVKFFDGDIASYLPVVDGVRLHRSLSFPSGHTSTFFIFATVCVILLLLNARNMRFRWLALCQIGLILLAALGGYSRIYLSQHFLLDVFVGSFIGICTPFVLLYYFRPKIS